MCSSDLARNASANLPGWGAGGGASSSIRCFPFLVGYSTFCLFPICITVGTRKKSECELVKVATYAKGNDIIFFCTRNLYWNTVSDSCTTKPVQSYLVSPIPTKPGDFVEIFELISRLPMNTNGIS